MEIYVLFTNKRSFVIISARMVSELVERGGKDILHPYK